MYGKFQIGNHTNHHIVIVHAALMVDIPDSKTNTTLGRKTSEPMFHHFLRFHRHKRTSQEGKGDVFLVGGLNPSEKY